MRPLPPGCGRGRWTTLSGMRTWSGPARCCARRSMPIGSPRSSYGDLPAPVRRLWRESLPRPPGPTSSQLSAVTSGVADLRAAIKAAADRLGMHGQRTVLFIDEIHRFNKAQQDAILPHVEDGTVILIGATTENPSFEVNSPLLSRSRVVVLHALTDDRHRRDRAARDDRLGAGSRIGEADDRRRRARSPGQPGQRRCPVRAEHARVRRHRRRASGEITDHESGRAGSPAPGRDLRQVRR